MLLAVLSVSALIWLVLGRREAAVVLIAIPVTLALTLFMFFLYGYTLNRITLFALIFSIGILVDDAIVVVENIVRHCAAEGGRVGRARGRGAARGGRGRQSHDPGHARRGGGDSAHGVRRRSDGPIHATDSGRRVGGDGLLARRGLCGDTVGVGPAPETVRSSGPRRRGSLHASLSACDGAAHRKRPQACAVSRGRGGAAAGGRGAGAARAGHRQDASLRQQERVSGHRRHAGRHGARSHRACRVHPGLGHAGG